MNRVYKVIWSKAKHCYVVTSEIAKGYGKSAGSKGVKALLSGLVALSIAMGGYGLADAVVYVDSKVATEGAYTTEVYTTTEADGKFAAKTVEAAVIDVANTVSELGGEYTALDGKVQAEAAAREAGDKTLDDRITAVKDYVLNETGKNYVSKADDAAVQDAGVVKKDKKIGENVTALGKGLYDETAARIGADAAQDKVIQQVNDSLVQSVNTINKNVADGFKDLNTADANEAKARTDADAAEKAARIGADAKLVEAVNSGITLSDDNVLQKNTTTVNADGNVTTKKADVTEMILNKGKDNQITLSEDGIKVGKNSTTMDKNGIYAGSDYDYGTAKAALDATEGKIRGADGNFKVNADGKVTANGGVDTNSGDILTRGGDIKAGSGDISGNNISASGNLHADGDISGKDITGSGMVRGRVVTDGTASMEGGKVQGTSVSDGTATLSGGSLNNAVDINASGTITGKNVVVKDNLTTTNLAVTGGLKTDRITLGSETLNQTDIYQGNVTSKVNDTVSGVEYTAESIFNKDGSSITARTDVGEHADSTGKSIVGAKEISQYLGDAAEPDASQKNVTRSMVRNGDTFYMEDKAEDKAVDGKNKYSTVRQNAEERTVTVTDGENTASTNLTAADIKNTAENGMISNTAKNLVNTASENMTNTVGGNLTTTVTGDSSLKAENITNEVKNRITNKAIDVETDATSSIVQKVTNDAGSNTSTQWSYQTKEEMSQADGKTASYLRGAAEEKSQLTDGSKKTTIDTVAGQTNTNITDGTNTSNDLQKANQIASSVTKGTNKTVVNQNAESLASSITAGTKVNNTNNTVDKSEQLIKVDDTHFYAETKTAGKAEEALKSGNTLIDIVKDTNTATVSSAVFDGATITGISQNAKDISLSAAGGTITNDANDVLNKGANSVINKVGDNKVAVKTDRVKVAYGSDTYTTWNDKGITSNTSGNMSNSATNITNSATKKLSNSAADIKNSATESITDKVGENVKRTMTTNKISESVKDGTKSNSFSKTAERDINIITDGTKTSTESQLADSVNTSLKEVDGKGKTTKSLNNVKTVSEDTTKMTDTASGAFSKRSQTVSQIQDKVGKTTVTTTDGLTELTNEDRDHKTVMDYANVTKDLNVNGDATVDQKLIVKGDSDLQGNATVGKNLEVKGTSTLTGDVTMESNATVTKDLTVKGASEFVGEAHFRKDVYVDNDLFVTGETRTDTLYVDHDGYVGGNLNVDGNIETHDAVLSADSRQVVTGRQLYQTNERVDRLDNRIKKVGANAAALAALRPGDFNPDDKFSIAAGFGSYRNANAAALGLFYRPNENVLLSLGTSFGDGENMVNAGVSVKFGRGKSMAERRKEMADEVSSMRDEMRSQDERIAELEEMLKKQSELIEKLSKES